MSIKKKRHRKQKKVKQDDVRHLDLSKMSAEEARRHLEGLIAKGNPKEAIHLLQQSNLVASPGFTLFRMRAYAARAHQLKRKGLEKEADLLLENLSSQLTGVGSMECREIAQVIAEAPLDFGMHYYRQHQDIHPSCPWIEQVLADHLVLSNSWESLSSLPDDHPLKKDGKLMAEAMPDLNAARWQDGLAKLDALSRKSSFASWKLFAKAMASAYGGEEEDLQRALKQLPDSFPLRSTVRMLREKGIRGLAPLHEKVQQLGQEDARSLVKAIGSKDRELPKLITQLAEKLFPQNPEMALRSLSETAAFALMKKNVSFERIGKLMPARFNKPILLRLQMFSIPETGSDASPFCLALRYSKDSDLEAAYIGEKQKVEAAVYFYLLTRVLVQRTSSWMIRPHDRSCLLQWLAEADLKTDDLYVATVEKITRMVPEVDVYYRIMQNLTPSSLTSQGKDLFERTLQRMQKQFPEDPFSYLQLSRLYRTKGAYRKSQKILEEAWKQAPYDPQVREQLGIGLLKAAIMSRKRKAFTLARKDLEEATKLNVKSLLPLVHAINATSVFLEEGNGGRADGPLATLAALPDPVLRFRSLLCFYQDLTESAGAGTRSFAQQVRLKTRKDLKSGLDKLSDSELGEIIAPFPEDFAYLVGKPDDLDFWSELWIKILGKLDDQHVLSVYTRLLSTTDEFVQIKWVKKDLKVRLKRRRDNVYLRFFSVLADYLLDPDNGSDDFFYLLEKLKDEDQQKLKDFCRKIASRFQEPLSDALGSFKFELLDEDDFLFGPAFFDDDFDEWDEDDNDLGFEEFPGAEFMGSNPAEIILAGLEKTGGNKELLQFLFEMLVSEMSSFRIDEEGLREMGRELEKRGRDLVRFLRQLYSGKNAKRLSRAGRLLLFPDEK
jgi:tetratricopeptide (TPR) repeat protein